MIWVIRRVETAAFLQSDLKSVRFRGSMPRPTTGNTEFRLDKNCWSVSLLNFVPQRAHTKMQLVLIRMIETVLVRVGNISGNPAVAPARGRWRL